MTINIIDLFSGAGGLTEGFRNPKINIISHVEMDSDACETLKLRDSYYYFKQIGKMNFYKDFLNKKISLDHLLNKVPTSILEKTLNYEISNNSINEIFQKINQQIHNKKINGIIGGPPCQAYSTIGRARNEKIKNKDKRIYLYKYYIQFLEEYNPDFFIFENVKGLKSFKDIDGNKLFPKILKDFKNIDESDPYNIRFKIIDASEYGVPQKRNRLFIFGCKQNIQFDFFNELENFKENGPTINQLFIDLPKLSAGETNNNYSNLSPNKFVTKFLRDTKLPLSQNISRPNNANDLDIYRRVVHAKNNGKNLKYSDLPDKLKTHKKTNIFLDRFKALDGNGYSHTVVAHISKDGHYYIHPDISQNRSITVREAARIQTFPDDYYFEHSRTAAFKQIGNAVPPYLSKKICSTILDNLYS